MPPCDNCVFWGNSKAAVAPSVYSRNLIFLEKYSESEQVNIKWPYGTSLFRFSERVSFNERYFCGALGFSWNQKTYHNGQLLMKYEFVHPCVAPLTKNLITVVCQLFMEPAFVDA